MKVFIWLVMSCALSFSDDNKYLRRKMVNFELRKEMWKKEVINMLWAWDKEKIWVSNRNGTHDLPNSGSVLCLLSYENSWRTKWPCSSWALVAQWIGHLPGVRKVNGSIHIGDSDCSLALRFWHFDHFILSFHKANLLLNLLSLFAIRN